MKPFRVLVVAPSPSLAVALSQWLLPKYDVITVTSYGAARAQLDSHPDAVLTPVRLGDFNGLQLAMHAQAMHVPVVVLDVDDPVLQKDAQQLGVTFFSSTEISRERLLNALDSVIVPAGDAGHAGGIGWASFSQYDLSHLPHSRRLLMH